MTATSTSTTGLDPRVAAVLCYSVWWVSGVVFLILERRHAGVRFHAAQAVVLFGAVSLVLLGLGAFSAVALVVAGTAYPVARLAADLLWAGAAVLWLVLIVRGWRGEMWRVPLVAALADRIATRTNW